MIVMAQMLRLFSVALLLVMGGGFQGMAKMTEESKNIEVSGPVHFTRVYTDDHGETRFSDEVLTFQLVDYAPPAPAISVSNVFEAENVSFISSPPGWHGDWHPAPRRQFILVLVGELEVEVSEGEVRRLKPGDLCLVEDTTGKGHASRVVGSMRVLAAAIPLAGD